MRTLLSIACASLFLLLAACSDSGKESADSPSPTQSTAQPETTALSARGVEEIKGALLTVRDLGEGWVVPDPDNSGEVRAKATASRPECQVLLDMRMSDENPQWGVFAEASFSTGGGHAFLDQWIASMGEELAKNEWQRYNDAATSCAEFERSINGSVTSMKVAERPFPDLGDASTSIVISVTHEGIRYDTWDLVVRVQQNIVYLSSSGFPTPIDADEFEKFAKLAIQRVENLN